MSAYVRTFVMLFMALLGDTTEDKSIKHTPSSFVWERSLTIRHLQATT